MQNYEQSAPGHQRPGSVASFTGTAGPPPPPPYGGNQGYQSATPQAQSQWASPAQNVAPSQQWNQPQQTTGGYNPGTYGAMPGAYSQGQQPPTQVSTAYPPQQQDVPPPPPPKPAAFAPQQQQNTHAWGQQPAYGAQQTTQGYQAPQQNTSFSQSQQGGYPQQSGYSSQGTQQPSYNATAPPPPSQTPGGSYFPPSQAQQGRPGSIYGADQAGVFSSPASAVAQQPPNSVLSPNEQQPAYIPPSLTGQGVQSYMPANTHPAPGVYIPPPPDIPAWQQAQHAPLQGGKKFKYTKPSVDPSFYAQGYQGGQQPAPQSGQQATPVQQPLQYGQVPQNQFQQQPQYGQPAQNQYAMPQQGQGGQTMQPPQSQYGQPAAQHQVPQQTPPQYGQMPYSQPSHTSPQPQSNQWQPATAGQNYGQQQATPSAYAAQQPGQQQAWQPGHQAQNSIADQQPGPGQDERIQAPRPVGNADTVPPGFINQPSPQSTPVSPIQHRNSIGYGSASNSTGLGRTGSVSSIALGAIHAQRAGNRTQSPKAPPPPKLPTPPPPRDDKSKFSVLAMGGPSDWEHLGAGVEEIDDEEWFGAKKEAKKAEAAQAESVELPAIVPSPPVAQGDWPSPASQSAPVNHRGHDNYQPTPPTSHTPVQRPASQTPQQGYVVADVPQQGPQSFVMGDAPLAASHTTQTPQPVQPTQHPSTQQGFVMDDTWVAQPTADQRNQATPVQGRQPPPTNTSFAVGDGNWAASHQTPGKATDWPTTQPDPAHLDEINAKDEAYERLRADAEKEKADIRLELSNLNVVIETVRSHAESERNLLVEQIDSLKAAATQAKNSTDASNKEQSTEIERLKEDAEGKDDTIKEKDVTIAQLRKELQDNNNAMAELKRQLEEKDNALAGMQEQLDAEKAREVSKPTTADLVPDIDPWYASSLERYITMLRSEAFEPLVEDKIKAFTSFLEAESGIRGLPYYSAPPPAPAMQETAQQNPEQNVGLSRRTSNSSIKKQDLNVHVPPVRQETQEDDFEYSPGGRPVLRHRPTIKSDETNSTQQSLNISGAPSGQTTTILTPTSSQDDASKTPTPMQSPPEEQSQPQYKAYVPPGISQEESARSLHRQSMSFSSAPPIALMQITPGSGKNHDEIFFGAGVADSATKPASRPSGISVSSDSVPAPLFAPKHSGATATPAPAPLPKRGPLDTLKELIPTKFVTSNSSELEAIRSRLSRISSDFSFIQETTGKWERAAALARKKNDEARRQRQEDSEAHTDELYNNNQISYVEIGPIEDEFKEKERELKAQEDREEYKTYVESVFDKAYDDLQSQIKSLMDLYIETERLVHTSVSGTKSMESVDVVSTAEALKLLKQIHDLIEVRHEKVVMAVSERDKRYKKTEIQPLYAAGNISKMKAVEKHFEKAEKQAVLRAKSEKAERIDALVRVAEEVVVGAVGIEQGEIDSILAAIRDLPPDSDETLLTRARETLLALKGSSKILLELFNNLEIELNSSVIVAEIAQARVEDAGPDRVTELEGEMAEGEKKAKEEFQRRVQVIDQDKDEIDGLIEEKGGKSVLSEEEEKKRRIARALEEAKRRNGDL